MRRFLLAGLVLMALAVVFVVARPGADRGGQAAEPVADQVQYPRSAKPLPVPEMVIVEGPWKDPLPTQIPSTLEGGLLPDGFTSCRTGSLEGPTCRND